MGSKFIIMRSLDWRFHGVGITLVEDDEDEGMPATCGP